MRQECILVYYIYYILYIHIHIYTYAYILQNCIYNFLLIMLIMYIV